MVLRTTVAFRVCATIAGAVAMALVYGVDDGALIAVLMLVMGIPVPTVAHLIARHRRRFARLSWQIVVGVVIVLAIDFAGIAVVASSVLTRRSVRALPVARLRVPARRLHRLVPHPRCRLRHISSRRRRHGEPVFPARPMLR